MRRVLLIGLDGFEKFPFIFHGRRNGRASRRLRAVDFAFRFRGQSDLVKFVGGFPDFRQERSARHGDDDVIWRFPTQLFHRLVEKGLGSFGIIRTDVDVDEGPFIFGADFAAESIDFVVSAADADEIRSKDESPENFSGFQITGNENVTFQTGGGGIGSD